MADKPISIALPAYRVPLTANEAELLGFFIEVWGQIDYFMGMCIAGFLKIDVVAAHTLMENMTTGPRLNLFHRLAAEHLTDPSLKKTEKDFNSDMRSLIEARNHIVHGLWGYWVDRKTNPETMIHAAHYAKKPKQPLLITELPTLVNRTVTQTHRIVAICQHLFGFTWIFDPNNPPSFFISADPPPDNWPQGSPVLRS